MVTHEDVRRIFHYNEETGVLTRKQRASPNAPAGQICDIIDSKGYIRVGILGERHRGHRIAWLYHHGEWPSKDIDHINGVKTDNRISNLRQATASENIGNCKNRKNNTSGFKGVYFAKNMNKWRAQITKNRKMKIIGYFMTPEEGHTAYMAAANDTFGEFARSA